MPGLLFFDGELLAQARVFHHGFFTFKQFRLKLAHLLMERLIFFAQVLQFADAPPQVCHAIADIGQLVGNRGDPLSKQLTHRGQRSTHVQPHQHPGSDAEHNCQDDITGDEEFSPRTFRWGLSI
jgi:hypothetical protein